MGLPLLYSRQNLGKSGQSWDYENRTTDMRPLDDTASTKMRSAATHFRVGLEV